MGDVSQSERNAAQLGRIEGKLDMLISSMTANEIKNAAVHKDLEVRIRGLEAWKSRSVGMITVIGGIAATVVTFVIKHFTGGGSV